MAKITKRSVDALQASDAGPTYLWDDALAGFGVKALPSGQKRYIVKYRTQGGGRSAPQRWMTLGTHGQITPDQARRMAQQTLAAVAMGSDPQSDKHQMRTAPSVADLWERYEQEHLPLKKPHTQYDYRNLWTRHLAGRFGTIKVDAMTRSDVDAFHKGLASKPYQANRALALLSVLLSHAEEWDWRESGSNPCRAIRKFAEKPRERFLSKEEIQNLGLAIRALVREGAISQTAAHLIELLLLTGARVGELLSARWDWVDIDAKIMRLPDSKTGAKPIYLSAPAIELLSRQKAICDACPFLFPSRDNTGHLAGISKPWAKVCERANLEGVRLHDLRHTVASIAVGQGASLPLIGRLLGHTQAQTTQRYAHVDVDPALKTANVIGVAVASAFNVGHDGDGDPSG